MVPKDVKNIPSIRRKEREKNRATYVHIVKLKNACFEFKPLLILTNLSEVQRVVSFGLGDVLFAWTKLKINMQINLIEFSCCPTGPFLLNQLCSVEKLPLCTVTCRFYPKYPL